MQTIEQWIPRKHIRIQTCTNSRPFLLCFIQPCNSSTPSATLTQTNWVFIQVTPPDRYVEQCFFFLFFLAMFDLEILSLILFLLSYLPLFLQLPRLGVHFLSSVPIALYQWFSIQQFLYREKGEAFIKSLHQVIFKLLMIRKERPY